MIFPPSSESSTLSPLNTQALFNAQVHCSDLKKKKMPASYMLDVPQSPKSTDYKFILHGDFSNKGIVEANSKI